MTKKTPRTFGEIACIKASRPPGSIPELTIDHMMRNHQRGIATQFVPDSNVVIDMIRAASEEETEEAKKARRRLAPFTAFMQSCSMQGVRYYISPYLGLNEMRRSEVGTGPSALNAFSDRYNLRWEDTHPDLQPNLDTTGILERGYRSLSLESQAVLSQDYAALLLILVVAREFPHLSAHAKFRTYLRLYRRIVDVVSVRAITIARFVLAPEPDPATEMHQTWTNISLNFTGRKDLRLRMPRTAHQMDKAALNGALDLLILNSTLVTDYHGLDGQRMDTWVLTADLKLAALTDAVHHTDLGTGETGLFVSTPDYRDEGPYWLQTHYDMEALNGKFRPHLKPSLKRQVARSLQAIALAEQGVLGTSAPPGAALRFSGIQEIKKDWPGHILCAAFN